MEIKTLEHIAFDTLFHAFEQAFSEYEMQYSEEQVRAMLKRRGFCPHLSFAAFDQGEIIAFTLNGTGLYNGLPTAYDTGTGTVKTYRGKGLAQEIFHQALPLLKEAGIKQYLLEVLQHNVQALTVYRKLGFETTRAFYYAIQRKDEIQNEIPASVPPCRIMPVRNEELVCSADFCDFSPSWQNSTDSVQRAGDALVRLGAYISSTLVGYCVFEPSSGDLTQIAVRHSHRRKGIASLLLQKMLEHDEADIVKTVNIEIPCPTLETFLSRKHINITGKQFEMLRKL